MYRSQSRITASNPSRLIKRLCNHWRHKFPVQLNEQGGDIGLPLGRCSLRANEGVLDARLESTDRAQLQQLQKVVADHLARMAGDEPLNIAWQTETGAEPAAQPAENRALDSRTRYGTVSRVFHWLMALLIVWQFLKLGDRIAEGEHWVGQTLVPWHVSLGAVLLVLVLLRIFWSASQLSRRPLHDPATAWLVKGGHLALYACMMAMPVTGVLYLVGNGYGLKVFGQQLVEKGPEIAWAASVGGLHSPLAWLTVLLVIGHIGAALYHRLVKRDDIMQRML
ncbi:DUF2218 domain-containing protein [Stutzerimonas frequens]|uniref:DUF2218 domain-containing protein n=1 Tax=Stutzerimonas frequens TaxID=2968969 RepID=A0ABX6XRV5_9GAMM|nr:DUF2218 domain-containing protein [Stutzerimonas frequens]MCQ4303487.1 DUF2218 domain-containing protein [Stutzerimonas frequens]PNF48955.1 DUF2218 domain-containing protein [Stutzerimonas frequens]QPT16750.1 DUF2218 domain-containing protein [Stutzerimonas frequens]